jgi:hypothetical protein
MVLKEDFKFYDKKLKNSKNNSKKDEKFYREVRDRGRYTQDAILLKCKDSVENQFSDIKKMKKKKKKS